MPTLYWPRRGRFVDYARNTEYHGEGTYDVPDDAVDQYLDRGWERPDSDDTDDSDDSADADAADSDDSDEATDDSAEDDTDDSAEDDGEDYICGAEKSNGEPCQNPVDGPDELCHVHADD